MDFSNFSKVSKIQILHYVKTNNKKEELINLHHSISNELHFSQLLRRFKNSLINSTPYSNQQKTNEDVDHHLEGENKSINESWYDGSIYQLLSIRRQVELRKNDEFSFFINNNNNNNNNNIMKVMENMKKDFNQFEMEKRNRILSSNFDFLDDENNNNNLTNEIFRKFIRMRNHMKYGRKTLHFAIGFYDQSEEYLQQLQSQFQVRYFRLKRKRKRIRSIEKQHLLHLPPILQSSHPTYQKYEFEESFQEFLSNNMNIHTVLSHQAKRKSTIILRGPQNSNNSANNHFYINHVGSQSSHSIKSTTTEESKKNKRGTRKYYENLINSTPEIFRVPTAHEITTERVANMMSAIHNTLQSHKISHEILPALQNKLNSAIEHFKVELISHLFDTQHEYQMRYLNDPIKRPSIYIFYQKLFQKLKNHFLSVEFLSKGAEDISTFRLKIKNSGRASAILSKTSSNSSSTSSDHHIDLFPPLENINDIEKKNSSQNSVPEIQLKKLFHSFEIDYSMDNNKNTSNNNNNNNNNINNNNDNINRDKKVFRSSIEDYLSYFHVIEDKKTKTQYYHCNQFDGTFIPNISNIFEEISQLILFSSSKSSNNYLTKNNQFPSSISDRLIKKVIKRNKRKNQLTTELIAQQIAKIISFRYANSIERCSPHLASQLANDAYQRITSYIEGGGKNILEALYDYEYLSSFIYPHQAHRLNSFPRRGDLPLSLDYISLHLLSSDPLLFSLSNNNINNDGNVHLVNNNYNNEKGEKENTSIFGTSFWSNQTAILDVSQSPPVLYATPDHIFYDQNNNYVCNSPVDYRVNWRNVGWRIGTKEEAKLFGMKRVNEFLDLNDEINEHLRLLSPSFISYLLSLPDNKKFASFLEK